MTPRPYVSGERQRPVDAGRDRILAAAQAVLKRGDIAAVSLEAVAAEAGVTRMTVYNQFGSKAGLYEELFEVIVTRGAFSQIPAVFAEKDVGAAFDGLVAVMGRFYADNREVMAKMRAAAGSDPDLDAAMRKKNERRRRAIETLVQRLGKEHRPTVPDAELVNTLDLLLSFNTFDTLAGPARTPSDVVPVMQRLIRGVLGVPATKKPRRARKKPAKP
jgi:AcrR family transcriptional regulator